MCPNRAGGLPFPGGEFCREPRRGVPLRAAGAQEGRQPAVFHPLVNLPFSLKGLGADGRLRKREKRERQRIFTTAWYNTFPHFGYRTATSNLGLRRRDMTVPRKPIASANRLQPQDVDNQHR